MGEVINFHAKAMQKAANEFDLMCLNQKCHHKWVAPAVGACPKCGERRIRLCGYKECDAPCRKA